MSKNESKDEFFFQEVLTDLYNRLQSDDLQLIVRWAKTGQLIEELLKDAPVALMGTVSSQPMRYKKIKVPSVDWLRLGGTISKDHPTPLEALESND